MKRLTRSFVFGEHEEYGYNGFRMLGIDSFEPSTAFGCAHDILEHFPDSDSSVEHELLALGAMFYVRGEDYFASIGKVHTSPGYHVSGDIVRLLETGETVSPCTFPVTRDSDVIEWTREALQIANKELAYQASDNEENEPALDTQTAGYITRYLAEGFRRAKKRYGKVPSYELLYTFQSLEKEFEKRAKYAEIGDRLDVTLSSLGHRLEFETKYTEVYETETEDY